MGNVIRFFPLWLQRMILVYRAAQHTKHVEVCLEYERADRRAAIWHQAKASEAIEALAQLNQRAELARMQ